MQPGNIWQVGRFGEGRAIPAIAADILNAGSFQRNKALLCVDPKVVVQQPPERISLAPGRSIMDG